MTFTDLGLAQRLATTVAALGYSNPTPIQEQAIPVVMQGKDIIGLAQTGTGKTAAFALPIIHKLMESKRRGVRALIVAPTRELAQQIVEAIKNYTEGTNIKSTAIYGGIRMGSQLKRLRDGVDIVVGCPGRLVDHLQRKTLDLSQLEVLVLDEADHMFDMGFLPDIKRLINFLPKKRQNLLFSATMPKEIRRLAEEILTDPVSIQVSNGEMAATVTHSLFPVSTELKSKLLEKILKQFEVKSTIIFARTKQRAKRLADSLQRTGYKVACLQGNLSQSRRQEAIKGFKDGQFDILVATDIAARGIDVQQVTHVINFDIPMTVEGYTHRIGRTGRAAKEGEAFTLISREDESRVRLIERHLGSKIERRSIDDFDYGIDGAPERVQSTDSRDSRKPRAGGASRKFGTRPGSFERPREQGRSFRAGAKPRSFRPEGRPEGDRRPIFKKDETSPPRAARAESSEPRGRFSDRRPERPAFAGRPSRDNRGDAAASTDRAASNSFDRRSEGRFSDRRPARPAFGSKPAFDKSESFPRRKWQDRGKRFDPQAPGSQSSQPRAERSFSADSRERKPYADRTGAKPFAKPAGRTYSKDRPAFSKDRPAFSKDKPAFAKDRPAGKRPAGKRPFGNRKPKSFGGRS